jgi:hypothetical protein
MKRTVIVALAVSAAIAAGCYRGMPPRIDLERMGDIGLIQFRSEAKGGLAAYATDVFLEVLFNSQPRARIKELGSEEEVLRDIGANRLSPEALAEIRRRFNVDAVVFGTLDASDVKPRVDLLSIITTLSVSADVDAGLSARMVDARDGTTIWADSARDRRTVANVSVSRSGGIFFDARDPERAYGSLVRSLVRQTTRDFRWR